MKRSLYSGAFEKFTLNAPEPRVTHRHSRMLLFTITFLLTILFSTLARAEDSTLLLTLTAEVNHTSVKNDLRIGNWRGGKDGKDPLDTPAMPNGLFDAYLELSSPPNGSNQYLWWDIRSSNPLQEWKLQIKSPSSKTVKMEWKQIPFSAGSGAILYTLFDPDTGHETLLDQGSGSLTFSISDPKTLILKSRLP